MLYRIKSKINFWQLINLFLFFFLFAPSAFACKCKFPTNEESLQTIKNAVFIGKFKVNTVSTPDAEGNEMIEITSIEPYKNDNYGTFRAIHYLSDCSRFVYKVGDVQEFAIFDDKKHYYRIGDSCTQITPADWQNLRKQGLDRAIKLNDEKDKCQDANGIWGFHGRMQIPRCLYRTKDAGKECTDKKDCQGSCVADLTEAEQKRLTRYQVTGQEWLKWMNSLRKTGKCSETVGLFGCHAYVKNGIVDGILCID